jgi:hypothetical protein
MDEAALIASRSGSITSGLSAVVSDRGFDRVETLVTDRPEHGRYYLSPATVDRLERRLPGADDTYLVVDGDVHPGRMVDLAARLSPVTLRDRRGAVWERLTGANPVAATRFELRQCRISRRAVARDDRDGATDAPGGTSDRLDGLDRRRDDLRGRLEERRRAARERTSTAYTGVDAHVVLLARPGTATAALRAALTGKEAAATAASDRPARATTATTAVGPHTVAVTDAPGVPGDGGIPSWVESVLPGLMVAIERADLVLGVGDRSGALLDAVGERVDAPCRSMGDADPGAVRQAIARTLPTAAYRLRLPYADATHALVADLHDEARVHDVTYREDVVVDVDVSARAADRLARRVADIGGDATPTDGR